MDHFQVAVHAIGDAANAELLAAIEDLRLIRATAGRIEYAQIIDPVDLPALPGTASLPHAAGPQTSDMHGRGADGARLAAGRLCLAHHARHRAAAGSDFPVKPHPFHGLAAAMSAGRQPSPPGGWMPQKDHSNRRSTPSPAAAAGFAEDRLGTSSRADGRLLFIDRDIFTLTDQRVRDTRCRDLDGRARSGSGATRLRSSGAPQAEEREPEPGAPLGGAKLRSSCQRKPGRVP